MGERSDNILHSGSMVIPANDTSVHQYELFSSTPFNDDWGIALVHIDSTSNLDDVTLSFIRTSARELVGVSRASQETASGSESFVLNAANSYAADIVGTRWRTGVSRNTALAVPFRVRKSVTCLSSHNAQSCSTNSVDSPFIASLARRNSSSTPKSCGDHPWQVEGT